MTDSAPRTDSPTGRPRVAVVFGGSSSEHAISCLTAGSVLAALDAERYDVVAIGITRSGRWVVVPEDLHDRLQVVDGRLPEISEDLLDAIWLRTTTGTDLAVRTEPPRTPNPPTAPIWSRCRRARAGPTGLPRRGLRAAARPVRRGRHHPGHVRDDGHPLRGRRGAGQRRRHGQELHEARARRLGSADRTLRAILPRDWEHDRAACLEAVAALHYPLFVKPARGGSSLGITRVSGPSELVAAIEHAHEFDPKVIIEEGFVDARELECGVLGSLGGGSPRPARSPRSGCTRESGFYDFEAKYLPEEQVDLDVPADIDAEIAEHVRGWRSGRSRRSAARGWPGSTCSSPAIARCTSTRSTRCPASPPHSMFPRMWAAGGLDYPELVDRLLQLALERPVGLR